MPERAGTTNSAGIVKFSWAGGEGNRVDRAPLVGGSWLVLTMGQAVMHGVL